MCCSLIQNKFVFSQFDTYAMSIIDRCFDNDENFAVDLLKQPAVAFDNVVPLKLAEQAKCRAFLASKCVQEHIQQKWSVLYFRHMCCIGYFYIIGLVILIINGQMFLCK